MQGLFFFLGNRGSTDVSAAHLQCGSSRWCHVIKHDKVAHTVRWAPRDLWEQVAHVDPTAANPAVSEYTRRNAIKRVDGKRFYD